MKLSMQQRDALLAGLALLGAALEAGSIKVDQANHEEDPVGDLLTNGGEHSGLTPTQVRELADVIVAEYPAPPVEATLAQEGR